MMKLSKPPASPPPRTAARHPAIGAGGRTAARRLGVRMMKLSKPPASPPRRTAAAGADTCARAAEAAREGGAGAYVRQLLRPARVFCGELVGARKDALPSNFRYRSFPVRSQSLPSLGAFRGLVSVWQARQSGTLSGAFCKRHF